MHTYTGDKSALYPAQHEAFKESTLTSPFLYSFNHSVTNSGEGGVFVQTELDHVHIDSGDPN